MNERRVFIPQRVTGSWQLYGLSPRYLLRLLPLPLVLCVGALSTYMLWDLVPHSSLLRMILRSFYIILFPVGMSGLWLALAVLPVADAGRTWWDVRVLSRTHRSQQTVFLPRRMMPPTPVEPTGLVPSPSPVSVRKSEEQDRTKSVAAGGSPSFGSLSPTELLFWAGLSALMVTPLLTLVGIFTGNRFAVQVASWLAKWVTRP